MEKKNKAFIYKFKNNGQFPNGVTLEALDADINAKEKAITDYQIAINEGKKSGLHNHASL